MHKIRGCSTLKGDISKDRLVYAIRKLLASKDAQQVRGSVLLCFF